MGISVPKERIRKLASIVCGSACFLVLKTAQVWSCEQLLQLPAWCNYCIATITFTIVGWAYHSKVSFRQPLSWATLARYITQAFAITAFDISFYNSLVYLFGLNTIIAVPVTALIVFVARVTVFFKYVFVPNQHQRSSESDPTLAKTGKTMAVQETQGLMSPFLRELRLNHVAREIPNNELIVLDLACGAGFLGAKLPRKCHYYGVDRIEADRNHLSLQTGAEEKSFLLQDLMEDDAVERIAAWLPEPADVITMAAFIEHVPDPVALIQKLTPLLKSGGLIVGTTPHPMGRNLHEMLAKVGICSQCGADEHEDFVDAEALQNVAQSIESLRLTECRRFLFGLNQCFVYAYDGAESQTLRFGRAEEFDLQPA